MLQYILLGAIGGLPAQAGSDIRLYINGKLFAPPVPPYLDTAGRTMIPLRAVMEYVGAQVEWQEREQKVIIRRDGNTLELWIGKRQAR
ncbi:MAG: copper amine oxidase N-terminal domain-containing protein, partial [Thermanaeromonas sp.]|nr:copper amine oxidase N-terminal domain-containing protein [Thermanaeromonas sp.]